MAHTLVIDTSYGSTVGIVGHEPIVETDSRTHVERLQANIARVMSEAGLAPADLDHVVVGAGPAPFTGLRAGIVAAKAIAFATGADLAGQDVLEPQARWNAIRRAVPHNAAPHEGNAVASAGAVDAGTAGVNAGAMAAESADAAATAHVLTLAVNDARRRQLYFALYDVADSQEEAVARDAAGAIIDIAAPRPLIAMDIDYPANIVTRVNRAVADLRARLAEGTPTEGALAADAAKAGMAGANPVAAKAEAAAPAGDVVALAPSAAAPRIVIDVIGHGVAKYAAAWDGSDGGAGIDGLGEVIDQSVLDQGARGLEIFAEGALARAAARKAAGQDAAPVEPLYLRRPDAEIPNPLKHVLGHGGADKALSPAGGAHAHDAAARLEGAR